MEQARFSVEQLYQMALKVASDDISFRTNITAVLYAISAACFVFLALRFLQVRLRNTCIGSVLLLFFVFSRMHGSIPSKIDTLGHDFANVAITKGVDNARKAQATELQYIHAVVVQYGVDTQQCKRTVNFHDFCSSNTSYYSHREINVWYEDIKHCTTTTDSNGREHETCWTEKRKHWDDEYTPWFTHIVRYWLVPDTKTKYLHPQIYEMNSDGSDAKPRVYLHPGWRAPEHAQEHIYRSEWPGSYNDHVPEFWSRVRQQASGGKVVVATFVGKYFHWGLASESAQFAVYAGHYQELKALVSLPGPDGMIFHYTDAFGQPNEMHTLLTSKDGELAFDFPPVVDIGFHQDNDTQALLDARAIEFQGHFGPNKEASARWFLVSDSIVNKLGGIQNATEALKAYLDDVSVWGHFRLPKNQVILVASISDDGKRITGRSMDTGMPFGNVLVIQKMRLSVEKGDSIPLSPENLFGNFSGTYVSDTQGILTYKFSDMVEAGAVIGILYEKTLGWQPPDPNSEECSTAPAEHLGFIRYSMCTQQYRESTIQVNKDGALLILDEVEGDVKSAIPYTTAVVSFIVMVILFFVFNIVQISDGNRSVYH